jgi:hypothetical protein
MRQRYGSKSLASRRQRLSQANVRSTTQRRGRTLKPWTLSDRLTISIEGHGRVRLGGIYSLERISKESPDDYWTVMETLTAFLRERSRRNEAERTSQDFKQRASRRAYFRLLAA